MSKIISKIYIVILGLVLIVPSGVLANEEYFEANTLSATSITTSGARLSGNISFNEGLGTAWFEYGVNGNLENSTSILRYVSKYEGAVQGVSKPLISLKPSTTYYYRVCLETTIKGLTCGETKSFKTKALPVASTTTSSTSSSSSNSSNSTSSSTSNSSTKDNDKKDVSDEEENSQTASVAGSTRDGNFLPDTFLEWVLTIILIFFIVMFGRYLYVKRQMEKEEEEKRQKEELIRAQLA